MRPHIKESRSNMGLLRSISLRKKWLRDARKFEEEKLLQEEDKKKSKHDLSGKKFGKNRRSSLRIRCPSNITGLSRFNSSGSYHIYIRDESCMCHLGREPFQELLSGYFQNLILFKSLGYIFELLPVDRFVLFFLHRCNGN